MIWAGEMAQGAGKGACCQARQPEFNPQNPFSVKKELIPASCAKDLANVHTLMCMCSVHTQVNK